MPFIKGRYHVNPAMGQALEAAREAEAALLALQRQARKNSAGASTSAPGHDSTDPEDPSSEDLADAQPAGPIHHVEIEVTQEAPPGQRLLEPGSSVPSNSGRATRGFVAHIHRTPAAPGEDFWNSASHSALPPETHVFSDHGDLVNFLREVLSKDSAQR